MTDDNRGLFFVIPWLILCVLAFFAAENLAPENRGLTLTYSGPAGYSRTVEN